MDGDDTPCALDAELFKEGSSHNRLGGNVGIWVQQRGSDDTDDDDGESSAKDLAGPAAESAARDSTQVSDNLRDRDSIARKAELVGEQRGIEILRAMRLLKIRC